MAQADLNVANQSGAGFRADVNNQLLALGTLQSGASAPGTTYAYMLWADTSTSPATLRQRNGANNAWIALGLLDTANFGLLALTGGTLTGALLVDDAGTAALPAVAFDGDTDTGLFRKAANQLGISTAGIECGYFDANGWNGPVVGAVNRSTAVTTTSGTSVSFTSLPSWVKRISIHLSGVSLSGTDNLLVRLSTGSSFVTSGYTSGCNYTDGVGLAIGAGVTSTAGLAIIAGQPTNSQTGTYTLTNIKDNIWVGQYVGIFDNGTQYVVYGAGKVDVGGTLDGIRLLPTGSNTFDAGTVNITYEG
jgi:hypothetical protein